MEQEAIDQSSSRNMSGRDVAEITPAEAPCRNSAGVTASMPMTYVYAIGRIERRFPTASVEKEFAQAIGRAETAGQTDQQAFHEALSKPENRYLVRELCWVFTIQGLETYILHPRDPRDFDRLMEAVRPQPSQVDIDVVIGTRGSVAPPGLCNGLMLPIVIFDQIYSFRQDALIEAIPRSKGMNDAQFEATAKHVFDRVLQMTDNAGATHEHRALNYLAMRYPGIYTRTAERFQEDFSLSAVDARASTLSGARTVINCIFSYTNRKTAFVEQSVVSVDTTEKFPFLSSGVSSYFNR